MNVHFKVYFLVKQGQKKCNNFYPISYLIAPFHPFYLNTCFSIYYMFPKQ